MEALAAAVAETVPRLVDARPDVPVLTMYIDLDPSEVGVQRSRAIAYTSAVDEAAKLVETYDTDHAGRVSLRDDIERARAYLFDELDPHGARAVAIFSATGADLFEPLTLSRSTPTRTFVDATPHIGPLVVATDRRDWLIVLVDARHARFLHGNPDAVEEIEHETRDVAGQHERQGPSDHQRWVEHEVQRNLKAAAAATEEIMRSGAHDRILIGGPPEIAPRFVEHHLSNPLREQLAGTMHVEVPDTTPDDVRRAAVAQFEADERRYEHAVLDRLAAGLARGERAAAGPDAVRAMLEQQRVETLAFDPRRMPHDDPRLEAAIKAALRQSADVLELRAVPDALAACDGIAAVLRF